MQQSLTLMSKKHIPDLYKAERGWGNNEKPSHKWGPGSIPAWCPAICWSSLWLLNLIDVCVKEFSPGTPVFLPPEKKPTFQNSSSNLERGPTGNPAWADLASLALYSNLIFITFRFLKAKDTKTLHLPTRFPLHFTGGGGMH